MSYVLQNKNNVKMQIVFDHPNKSLTQHILYILDKRSDKVYAHPNYTTKLLSIDLAGPHIQIAMGNVSLPVHLRKFCNET